MKYQQLIWFIIVTFCLISSVYTLSTRYHRALPSCRKTKYSYSTLSLTWLGQYCTQSKCSYNWRNNWDRRSFVVHGYWPASTDLAFLSCQKDNGFDQYCYQDYQFDQYLLYDMRKDLNRVWPEIGSIKNFRQYQWDKHGTCYMKITLQSYNKPKLSEDDIFKKYFKGIISKYDSLPLNKINKFTIYNKKDLATQINLKQDQFLVICGADSELDQIRICYDLAEPEKQTIIKCPGSKPKQCSYPFVMKQ